jgi:hypothetical protein
MPELQSRHHFSDSRLKKRYRTFPSAFQKTYCLPESQPIGTPSVSPVWSAQFDGRQRSGFPVLATDR